MEKTIKKLSLIVLLIFTILNVTSTKIYASAESVAVVKVDEDYIVYINNMESEDFKFAFTNDTTLTESNVTTELSFVSNWTDTNDIHVACIEGTSGLDENAPIIMWIQKGEELSSTEIMLEKAITKEEMIAVENLTQNIKVSTENATTVASNEDGVARTETVGQIDIIDSEEYDYKYQLIKIDDTASNNATELIGIVDELQNTYSSLSMYNKVLTVQKIINLYDSLKEEANWMDVENRTIYQPIESNDGDQYIVLIRQLSNGDVVQEDIQFLICTNGHQEEYVKEAHVIKQTSTLPVTYDSIILFIILAVIIIVAIMVIIRMKKLRAEKDE